MKRELLLYAFLMALLLGVLKVLEYNYLLKELSAEWYIGLIAFIFTGMGIWMGNKWKKDQKATLSSSQDPIHIREEKRIALNISKREAEVLELIAQGLSNQEIADTLFISIHTVKTHSSKLFSKLDVTSRTKAIQKAKAMELIA